MKQKTIKGMLSAALALTLVMPSIGDCEVYAANNEIQYEFSGEDAGTPGYAQGQVTFTAKEAGSYYLYWADDDKALEGYYEIATMKLEAGESNTFTFGYHTAIPADTTKIIATKEKTKLGVKDAVAVYDIPKNKQLSGGAGDLLYTFNSYSDVHIDTEVYYTNCQKNWKNALKYAKDKDTDFIVSAGDAVTNAKGFAEEWDVYEKILADSDYTNPVWETNGNHDMRDETSTDGTALKDGVKKYDYKGNLAFNKATGTDSTVANINANKPYYYVIEKNTKDVFIFMALENGYKPANHDNFSKEQIEWVKDVLDTFYGTGVNVYIIEHATFQGYGPGDVWKKNSNGSYSSYYGGHMYANGMKTSNGTTISGMDQNTAFKEILDTYKDVIWMSGHTHQDFNLGNNYSNENGTACNMIHNPGVVGTTYLNEKNQIEYDSSSSANDGKGLNSQGYYVETYENAVVYYGANLTEEKIYPAYCYIMEGSRKSEPITLSEDRKEVVPISETLVPEKEVIPGDATLEEALSLTQNMLVKYYTYASYDQYQQLKKYYYKYNENNVIADKQKAVEDLKYAGGQLYAVIHKNVAVDENTHYALCYYSKDTHAWSTVDTYFSKIEEGVYECVYTAQNTNDISTNVYDTVTSAYHCIGESTAITFTEDLTEKFTLNDPADARGKSITIKGMEIGSQVRFLYDSKENQLTIAMGAPVVTPTATVEPTVTEKPTVTVEPTAIVKPSATQAPTVTVTAEPTATGRPTSTGTPTATVKPTVTARPTATTKPTATVKPTSTVTPTAIGKPTVTAKPTSTVQPTVTGTVTKTPSPTVTLKPTATAQPTVTKVATQTPKVTQMPTVTKAGKITTAPTKAPVVKKGMVYRDKKTKAVYKVTKTGKNKTVQYVKPTNSKVTVAVIPATIKIRGSAYKVTSIASKALQKKTRLKKVVIGSNVSSIGKNAFYGCKKLKTIQIKTTKLTAKKVGKNAFKGINKKAKFKVPAKKKKLYQKFLKV